METATVSRWFWRGDELYMRWIAEPIGGAIEAVLRACHVRPYWQPPRDR